MTGPANPWDDPTYRPEFTGDERRGKRERLAEIMAAGRVRVAKQPGLEGTGARAPEATARGFVAGPTHTEAPVAPVEAPAAPKPTIEEEPVAKKYTVKCALCSKKFAGPSALCGHSWACKGRPAPKPGPAPEVKPARPAAEVAPARRVVVRVASGLTVEVESVAEAAEFARLYVGGQAS